MPYFQKEAKRTIFPTGSTSHYFGARHLQQMALERYGDQLG